MCYNNCCLLQEFDELESYGLDENYDVMYDSDDGKVTLIKKQKGDEGENKAEGEPEGVAGGVPEEHQTQEDLNKHVDDPQTNQNQENPPEHNSQAPPPQKPDEVDKPVPQGNTSICLERQSCNLFFLF